MREMEPHVNIYLAMNRVNIAVIYTLKSIIKKLPVFLMVK